VKLIERTFELRGPEGLGAKPRPELIGPVLGRVRQTLLDSVRMGFLHSSHARGRIPSCLQKAAEVRYTGHAAGKDGSTLLHFEVPEFGSVAAELFEQGQLWSSGPKPEQSAFELLAESLRDVRQKATNSERFDHALLRRFASYRHLLRRGLSSIALPDADISDTESIDESLSEAAESLFRETPPARRVRLCGRLDLLGVSKRVMGLVLEDGAAVTAVWTAEGFVDLASFLDKQVVIEGLAEFRPSGSLLRVDADAVRYADASDASFSTLPLPEVRLSYQKLAASVRPGQKPYASIFGLIPGEESDEEFAAAVAELS
jgi:hypothetical protein